MPLESLATIARRTQDEPLAARLETAIKCGADYVELRRGEVSIPLHREVTWIEPMSFKLSLRLPEPELICYGTWAPERKRRKRVQKRINKRKGALRFGDEVIEKWPPPVSLKTRTAPIIKMMVDKPEHPNSLILEFDYLEGYIVAAVDIRKFKE